MGRLSGFTYDEATRRFNLLGLIYDRHGGRHEIWRTSSGKRISVPHHSKAIAEGTLRAILREAGITPEQFLAAR